MRLVPKLRNVKTSACPIARFVRAQWQEFDAQRRHTVFKNRTHLEGSCSPASDRGGPQRHPAISLYDGLFSEVVSVVGGHDSFLGDESQAIQPGILEWRSTAVRCVKGHL